MFSTVVRAVVKYKSSGFLQFIALNRSVEWIVRYHFEQFIILKMSTELACSVLKSDIVYVNLMVKVNTFNL